MDATFPGGSMRKSCPALKAALLATSAVALCGLWIETAQAGGFAIREQSAQFQGSSFAGNAAGGGLSSMFWNPAALGQAGAGLTSESHFSGIFAQSQVTVTDYDFNPDLGKKGIPNPELLSLSSNSGDIGIPALVGSSYYAYRLNDRLTLGLSLNSGFGLASKPRDLSYLGAELARTTKLFTINAAPTLAYKIMPGVIVGAGVQVQYARAKFSFATASPIFESSTFRDADGFAVGATAGILLQPTSTTTIGIGYRSQISHELDGKFDGFTPPSTREPTVGGSADLDLPDIVTVSLRQEIAPNMRLLGTIEWSNWSRFKQLQVNLDNGAVVGPLEANWSDGWFFALGGEYDVYRGLTVRAGAAYEIAPVDSPEKRFTSIPDSNRFWLSAGATVQLNESMSADFAYTHVFLENGDFHRETLADNVVTGYTESQVDIWSASLKMKWGGERPVEPLK